MYFKIPDEGYSHWSMARSLEPNRETVLTFTPWTPKWPGDHYYNGSLVAGDMDPSNDALDGSVFVRLGAGVLETMDDERGVMNRPPTIVRGVFVLSPSPRPRVSASPCLLDACGRKVLDLRPGPNDVRALAPGVFFVHEEPSAVTKVVIAH